MATALANHNIDALLGTIQASANTDSHCVVVDYLYVNDPDDKLTKLKDELDQVCAAKGVTCYTEISAGILWASSRQPKKKQQPIKDPQPIIPVIPQHYELTIRKIARRVAINYQLSDADRDDLEQEMNLKLCEIAASGKSYAPRQVEFALGNAARIYIREEVTCPKAKFGSAMSRIEEAITEPADEDYKPRHTTWFERDLTVYTLLSYLSDDWRYVVERYFGFNGWEMSQRELAELFETSEETISWWLKSSLRVMREVYKRRDV